MGRNRWSHSMPRTEDVDWGKVMYQKRQRLAADAATGKWVLVYVNIVNPQSLKSRDGRVPEQQFFALLGPRLTLKDQLRKLFRGYVSDWALVGTYMDCDVYEVNVAYELSKDEVARMGGYDMADRWYWQWALDPDNHIARSTVKMWARDYESLLQRMANAM